jgi:hypothetical protein
MAKLRKITPSQHDRIRQDARAHLLVVGADEFRRAVDAVRAEAERARLRTGRAAPPRTRAA